MRPRFLVIGVVVLALSSAAFVRADGPGLQMLEMGTGPTVVLVPGLGLSRTDWLPTVKRLRDRYHCVMVEIPGQGTSPLPDPFSLQIAAEALDGVLARQKAESTIVVGSGVGGVLALMAASAHPEHVRGVMLIDTQVKSPLPVTEQQRDQVLKFMEENYAQFLPMAFSRMGRDSAESERLFTMMSTVPPVTVKTYIRNLLTLDGNRDLKGLKVPLALTLTERGWKTGVPWGTVAHAYGIEDSTIAVPTRIAGAGTMVMKDQPDTLAAVITAFAQKSFATKR